MRINSCVSNGNSLIPIEVELTLWPGLPTIQIIGLPDQHLKESIVRIKSAIKSSGFEFPKAQQIVVNLRPSHFKKTSRGLDLAIATAFLLETEQIKPFHPVSELLVYGELNLTGEVFQPLDLENLPSTIIGTLLTGKPSTAQKNPLSISYFQVSNLLELPSPLKIKGRSIQSKMTSFARPTPAKPIYLSESESFVLKLAAQLHLHILFAGPAGSGKSTLAKALHFLRPTPEASDWQKLTCSQQKMQQEITFFPLVKPHHSIPLHSMVGGGSSPQIGEISRAHGGILLLDELLEYKSEVLESLREPLEEKQIRVSRGQNVETYPADFQLVATTNLCPCGDYVPSDPTDKEKAYRSCRYSYRRCHSYAERITGPLLDRFDIIHFMKKSEPRKINLKDLLDEIEKETSKANYDTSPPSKVDALCDFLPEETHSSFLPNLQFLQLSYRRRLALHKLAHAIADMNGSASVAPEHWQKAIELTISPFEKLRRWEL